MTIQSEERFMASLWDWGILKGCFGDSKIEPTDMDGLVERKGHFLVLEAKQPGVKIKQGQWWTFNALVNTGYLPLLFCGAKEISRRKCRFYIRCHIRRHQKGQPTYDN